MHGLSSVLLHFTKNAGDCSNVLCLDLPICETGERLEVPEGHCCPECVPDTLNCSAVLCILPVCNDCEEHVIPDGECCPVCQPIVIEIECGIEGQVPSSCASLCPPTCEERNTSFCPSVCVEGCVCPSGQVIDTKNSKCVYEEDCPIQGIYIYKVSM